MHGWYPGKVIQNYPQAYLQGIGRAATTMSALPMHHQPMRMHASQGATSR
jgi:hypothetical protein